MAERFENEVAQMKKLGETMINGKDKDILTLLEIGGIGNSIKKSLKHGEWLAWQENHKDAFPFDISMLNKSMRMDKNKAKLLDAHGQPTANTVREAMVRLAGAKTGKPRTPAETPCKDEITRLRAIARRQKAGKPITDEDRRRANHDIDIVRGWLTEVEQEGKVSQVRLSPGNGATTQATRLHTLPTPEQRIYKLLDVAGLLTAGAQSAGKNGYGVNHLENLFRQTPSVEPANKNAITEAEVAAIARELKVTLPTNALSNTA